LALLLIGVGCTDLAHSVRHTRFLPGTCGAVATVVVGLLAGLTGWPDLAAVLVVAAFAFTWELAVSRGLTIMPLRLEQIQPTKSMAYYMAGVHWIDAISPPPNQRFPAGDATITIGLKF